MKKLCVILMMVGLVGCGETKNDISFEDVLTNLGVETSVGRPKDKDGYDLAEDYHPLARRITAFSKRTELHMAGIRVASGDYQDRHQVLVNDRAEDYLPFYSSDGDEGWATPSDVAKESIYVKSIASDINEDGIEEVFLLSYNPTNRLMYFKTIYHQGDSYAENEAREPLEFLIHVINDVNKPWRDHFYTYLLDLDADDLDGDERDEYVIVAGNTLLVLDDAGNGFSELDRISFSADPLTNEQFTRAAMGDLTGDGRADVIVFDGINDKKQAKYYLYSLEANRLKLVRDNWLKVEVAGITLEYEFGNVAVGDIDGDRRNEVLFAGNTTSGGDNYDLVVMDDYRNDYKFLANAHYRASLGDYLGKRLIPPLEVIQLDGLENGLAKEILVDRRLLRLNNDEELELLDTDMVPDFFQDKLTIGDMDGNGREEVILGTQDQKGVVVFGRNDVGNLETLAEFDGYEIFFGSALCAANVDFDSPVVRATGDRQVRFTKPQILAILASPPYHAGVQDPSDAYTAFGSKHEETQETTNSYGFHVGASVGYSFEFSFFGFKTESEFKLTVDTALDWSDSTSLSQSVSRHFVCPAGEDQVIFTVIPFDIYSYEVLSAPDPRAIGEIMTINVPRAPVTIPMERHRYNELNGVHNEIIPDITDEVLTHRIGDPTSYPSKAEKHSLTQSKDAQDYGWLALQENMVITPGQGGGGQIMTVTKEAGTAEGFNFDLSIDLEWSNVTGSVLWGAQAGFHYGYETRFETEDETQIEGWIPNFPPDKHKPSLDYTCGLFAYPQRLGDNIFPVVTYWVE